MDKFIKHLKNTNILTNFDIEDICKVLRVPLVKIACKDEVDKLKQGCYILNLDDSDGQGTHWCAFIITDYYVLYCDSYGMPPPQDVYQLFLKSKKDLYVNQRQYQHVDSVLCGYFAVYFLYSMIFLKGENMLIKYKKFVNQWDKRSLMKNDRVKNILLHIINTTYTK